jgi:hypothetical protein
MLEDRKLLSQRKVLEDEIASTAECRSKGAEEAENDGGHYVRMLQVGRRRQWRSEGRGSAGGAAFATDGTDGSRDGILARHNAPRSWRHRSRHSKFQPCSLRWFPPHRRPSSAA